MKDYPELTEVFTRGGMIEAGMENYELRNEQLDMALRIEEALATNEHLIIEAGTGIGKSLAYLVPLIIYAKTKRKRAIVATYTKTLQEQLTKKDLPFLVKALPFKFNFALCLGSANYLCLRRLHKSRQLGLFKDDDDLREWDEIARWSRKTKTGVKLDAEFKISDKIWMEVCRESDMCTGRKCPYGSLCFYNRSKIERSNADILVSNHHLFFTDIASGNKILPPYGAALIDEAHNAEDVAAEFLGAEFSYGNMTYILGRLTGGRDFGLDSGTSDEILKSAARTEMHVKELFRAVIARFGREKTLRRVREKHIFNGTTGASIQELAGMVRAAASKMKDENGDTSDEGAELGAYAGRLGEAKNALELFLDQSEPDFVYWADIKPAGRRLRASLYSCPLDVSRILRQTLYKNTDSVIMTSATMCVNDSFEYMKERLGMINAGELRLGSPFDYKKQALLYVAGDLPSPSGDFDEFEQKALERMGSICAAAGGGTFVLFTSWKSLEKAHDYLKKNIPGLNFLKQGQMNRWQLLETFKNKSSAVLLGTNSFWQGVDVPGEALRCVIIFKLPFAVPDNPLTEARIEKLKEEGKNAFAHYQIPQAAIMLKQGVGRLIRTKTDRGVIAVLDPRVLLSSYGKIFLRSLPDCAISSDIEEISAFIPFHGPDKPKRSSRQK
ncbi:MAG: helicase C-terminal domain-containing protein [Elusimicrobiota bacterium]|nr:helicase C-terminal domain-containing protein [Elusimicrobiota bacterium]